MKRILAIFLALFTLMALSACGAPDNSTVADTATTVPTSSPNHADNNSGSSDTGEQNNTTAEVINVETPENFVLIKGVTFQMGSPDSEAWRGADEKATCRYGQRFLYRHF
ncbi:MAG: hypothetical protein LBS62_04360 [Clostridiales bacterium]|jgi:formylglycine-generating enzyme required for sulfatase activity|nr:hypothetical protein [Clostridiales bacterium]